MTNRQPPSPLDVASDLGGALVALSTILMAAFPFALPLVALTAVAAIPLLLPVLALGLVVAVVAAPVVLVRRIVAGLRIDERSRRRRVQAAEI